MCGCWCPDEEPTEEEVDKFFEDDEAEQAEGEPIPVEIPKRVEVDA